MTRNIQAIYENGVLRPLEPIHLAEKELVTVTIMDKAEATNGAVSIPEPAPLSDEDFERLLDELASGPTLPRLPSGFSRANIYADHD